MKTVRALFAIALAAVAVSACSAADGAEPAAAPTPPAGGGPAAAATAVTVRDPWVKTAATGMTAAFGTLLNSSGADVTVVSATASASSMVELHEVATVAGSAGGGACRTTA